MNFASSANNEIATAICETATCPDIGGITKVFCVSRVVKHGMSFTFAGDSGAVSTPDGACIKIHVEGHLYSLPAIP
eukprot:scaffold488204_cov22-Prasinocladus_malaysianus.AAC.1